MSINGINTPLGNYGSIARPETARTNDGRGAGHANGATQGTSLPTPAALRAQTPIAGANASSSAVPAEAPEGTDPTLWSVLTSEERAFFAKTAAMGPLTYGRIKAVTHPAPPAARGVRLDVRA